MHGHSHSDGRDGRARIKWVFIGFALVGAFFLFAEHRAHALSFLPWLLLLACPLMHVFMHGKHGHGHHGDQSPRAVDEPTRSSTPQ